MFFPFIYNQLGKYMDTFLNKLLCGFRKIHFTQHALFKLLQWWQNELGNSGLECTVLMDLSKAYDCIPHDLIMANFEACGLSISSLILLMDYLTSRKQRVKVGPSFSLRDEIKGSIWQSKSASQSSILVPLWFNVFINDIFVHWEKSDFEFCLRLWRRFI